MLCTAALDLVQNPFIANTGGTDGLGLWMEVANVPWTGAGLAACAVERPRRTPDDSAVELALVVLPRLRRMFDVNDRWFVTAKKRRRCVQTDKFVHVKDTLPRGDGDSAQTLSGSEDMASATAVRLGSNSEMIIKVMY